MSMKFLPLTKPKKSLFACGSNEEVNVNAPDTFRLNGFLTVMDEALQSIQTRFEQYEERCSSLGFHFSSTTLQNICNNDPLNSCKDMDLLFQTLFSQDQKALIFYNETLLFKQSYRCECSISTYSCIKENATPFPNIYTVLRILLTMSVNVAYSERSFSILTITKHYLRSTVPTAVMRCRCHSFPLNMMWYISSL